MQTIHNRSSIGTYDIHTTDVRLLLLHSCVQNPSCRQLAFCTRALYCQTYPFKCKMQHLTRGGLGCRQSPTGLEVQCKPGQKRRFRTFIYTLSPFIPHLFATLNRWVPYQTLPHSSSAVSAGGGMVWGLPSYWGNMCFGVRFPCPLSS